MKKRILAAALAAATAVSAFAGCGGGETSDGTITVAIMDRGKVPSGEGSYEDNRWTRWISQECGVNVEWIPVARDQYQDKINAMMAADNAPDVIPEYDAAYIGNLINQGVLQPVGEAIDKYSTDYKEYIAANPELEKFVKFDGETYAFTSKRASNLNHGAWIREDWLEKVNLPMPETDEDLLNVARAFKDAKLGGDNTVAFSLITWYDVFPALYNCTYQWYVEDGKVEYGAMTERHKDAIGFLKTCYDEGLISKEFVTDSDKTQARQQWANGQAGILINTWDSRENTDLLKNDPSARPVPMPPVKTKYGQGAYYQEASPCFYVVFNKNLKNTEAAVKYLDWMISKGWHSLVYGVENEHYVMENGIEKRLDEDKYNNEVAYAADYAVLYQDKTTRESLLAKATEDKLSQTLAQERAASFELNSQYPYRRDMPRVPDVSEFARINSEWGKKRDEIRIKAITGGTQYSPQWLHDEYVKSWNELGGEQVNELVQKWYDENKESWK